MSSSPPNGPPPSFRTSIAMGSSPLYITTLPNAVNSSIYPTSSQPISANQRYSLQQPIGAVGVDALEPLRRFSAAATTSNSPTDSIRSHLSSNRNSGQQYNVVGVSPLRDSAAAQAIQERPPSYSQSKFDPNVNNYTKSNIYATVMNTSDNEVSQPVVGAISLKGNGTIVTEELPPDKLTSPRRIQDKSSLSKTLCGCLSFVCACPMLTLVCLFSIVEIGAIVLFNSLQTIGYDPTDHSNNKTIFIMIVVGQVVTFIAVLLCCAGATLLAVSSMCDNTLSRTDTKNRFTVSMIVIIFTLVFLVLLMIRGGIEGYSTKLVLDKIMPVFQDFSTLKDNIAAVPLLVVVAMFGLCVLTILVCGFMAFVCCCWFCCASTCLYTKQRKREKKSENIDTNISNISHV